MCSFFKLNSQENERNTPEIKRNVLIFSSFNSPRHSGFDVGNNNLHTEITSSRWWPRNESERNNFVTSWKKKKKKSSQINTIPSPKTSVLSPFTVEIPQRSWHEPSAALVRRVESLLVAFEMLFRFLLGFFFGGWRGGSVRASSQTKPREQPCSLGATAGCLWRDPFR